jgi:hypothetical protein
MTSCFFVVLMCMSATPQEPPFPPSSRASSEGPGWAGTRKISVTGMECGDVTAFTAGGAGMRASKLHAYRLLHAAAPPQVKAVTKSPHSIPLASVGIFALRLRFAPVHRTRCFSAGLPGAAQHFQCRTAVEMVARHRVSEPLVSKTQSQRGTFVRRHGGEPVALFLFERLRHSAAHRVEYKRGSLPHRRHPPHRHPTPYVFTISSTARRLAIRAPWIQPWSVEQCSPAKKRRPSGRMAAG